MDHIWCILISCGITYLLIRYELDRIWLSLKDVLEQAGKWTMEDRIRMNEIVKDINKYYGGIRKIK